MQTIADRTPTITGVEIIADDVACLMQPIVNLFFVGPESAGDREWVLVDAGLPGLTGSIVKAAAERFGPDSRPSAIVMTHGHFDHVGALEELAERWDVPVYAHPMELPYLTGRASYPPPDPTVGGGGMAWLSWMYPRGPVDVGDRARPFPGDGSVPEMPGWRVVETPGHAPGHVSLYRDIDGLLLAGDAFVTTKQESTIAALTKPLQMHGPPMYFTPDWESARRSVERLAELQPAIAATGHGKPMRGEELRRELEALSSEFERRAVPRRGRYVNHPALVDEQGVVAVPVDNGFPVALAAFGAAVAVGFALGSLTGGSDD